MLFHDDYAVSFPFKTAEKLNPTTLLGSKTSNTPHPSLDTRMTLPPQDGQAGESTTVGSAPEAQAGADQFSATHEHDSKALSADHVSRRPILQVRLVDEKIGFRVFALRSFAKGEQLFRERIALEATYHAHPKGTRNVYERYKGLSAARRAAMHGAFPVLAAVNGIDAKTAAASRQLIPSRLISPQAAVDIVVTAEQHMRMRPRQSRCRRFLGHWRKDAKQETLEWFTRYAFRLEPSSTVSQGRSQAGVYLLTGLINHRCPGHFNCRVVTSVDEVKLIAERNIADGEELTINYQKDKRDFSCRGPCCRPR